MIWSLWTRTASLHRQLVAVTLAFCIVLAVALAVVLKAADGTRRRLHSATQSVVAEQRVGDAIDQAVMRQLATVSAYAQRPQERLKQQFRISGDRAYAQIHTYLFRDLSVEERLQVERAKGAHQSFEVAATRAQELVSRGEVRASQEAMDEMAAHVFELLAALEGFMRMRAEGLADLEGQHGRAILLIYVCGGALVAISGLGPLLVGWFLRERVTIPLAEFASAAKKIAAGDLSAKVSEAQASEFQDAVRAFNQMGVSLETATDRLMERNSQLVAALSDIRRARAELTQSEKLSALGRMSAGLAHELNNPLASVLGFLELLDLQVEEGRALSGEKLREEFLRPMLAEGTRARNLVMSFLQVSRKSNSEIEAIDLTESLRLVLEMRRYAAEQAGVAVRENLGEPVWVFAEATRLQGVVLNLINNAIDAMCRSEGGTIEIHTRSTDKLVELVVEDTGPGIRDLEKAFEPFYTTKPAGSGTGLGLALVHRSMEEFGGAVRAENRSEGGARFVLTFNRAGPNQESEGPPNDEGSSCPSATSAEGPVVLVVEDEEQLRTLHERILSRAFGEVLLASSVAEARSIIEARRVDVIISDVKMPGESGVVLLEWVRRHHPRLGRRFLFVTGDVGGEEVAALAAHSPELLIQKPFRIADYLLRVTAVLGAA